MVRAGWSWRQTHLKPPGTLFLQPALTRVGIFAAHARLSIVVFVAKRSDDRGHSLREKQQTTRASRLPFESLVQDYSQQDAVVAAKKPSIRSVRFLIFQMRNQRRRQLPIGAVRPVSSRQDEPSRNSWRGSGECSERNS